jgi:hypothetical protein
MTKTFTTFTSRKDASLTGFRADDNKALLDAICGNPITGHVREGFNCTLVPNHAAEAVANHLIAQGWTRS